MMIGYVALLDVLGFTSIVSGDGSLARLEDYLKCVQGALQPTDGDKRVDYVVFSDSVVLTTPDDSRESLRSILRSCSQLFGETLKRRIALRGAIAHGSFVRSQLASGAFIAGRAIVDAYKFEVIQDWVGIMLTPSLLRSVDDLDSLCTLTQNPSPENLALHEGRLPWCVYVQPCQKIQFHESGGQSTYDGYAIVPTSGRTDSPGMVESLQESIQALKRLRSMAPDPAAQAKYESAIEWLSERERRWKRIAAFEQKARESAQRETAV